MLRKYNLRKKGKEKNENLPITCLQSCGRATERKDRKQRNQQGLHLKKTDDYLKKRCLKARTRDCHDVDWPSLKRGENSGERV